MAFSGKGGGKSFGFKGYGSDRTATTLGGLAPQWNAKTPPGWGPETGTPFRQWVRDLQMWNLATDVDDYRKGPLIVLQLT